MVITQEQVQITLKQGEIAQAYFLGWGVGFEVCIECEDGKVLSGFSSGNACTGHINEQTGQSVPTDRVWTEHWTVLDEKHSEIAKWLVEAAQAMERVTYSK